MYSQLFYSANSYRSTLLAPQNPTQDEREALEAYMYLTSVFIHVANVRPNFKRC